MLIYSSILLHTNLITLCCSIKIFFKNSRKGPALWHNSISLCRQRHHHIWTQVLAIPLPTQFPAKGLGKQLTIPRWENWMKFLVPAFSWVQLWLLWPFGESTNRWKIAASSSLQLCFLSKCLKNNKNRSQCYGVASKATACHASTPYG